MPLHPCYPKNNHLLVNCIAVKVSTLQKCVWENSSFQEPVGSLCAPCLSLFLTLALGIELLALYLILPLGDMLNVLLKYWWCAHMP